MRKVLTLVFVTLLSVAMAADTAACGRMKGKACSMRANAGNCCAAIKDVKRQVKNTANGAIITLTSNSLKSVKALQARIASCGKMSGKACSMRANAENCCAAMKDVKRQVKNTAKGVIITLTSTNAASVKALQTEVASCGKMSGKTCPRRMNAGGCTRKTAVPKT